MTKKGGWGGCQPLTKMLWLFFSVRQSPHLSLIKTALSCDHVRAEGQQQDKRLTGSVDYNRREESQPAVARVTFSVKRLDVTQNKSSTAAEPQICLGPRE